MKRTIKLIIGQTGTGKTWYVLHTILPNEKRLIIIDIHHEYTYDNAFYAYSLEELYDFVLNNKDFHIVVRFTSFFELEYLWRLIYAIGNLTLVCEEIGSYIDAEKKDTSFNRLIFFGRHAGISIVGVAQRPILLSTSLRSQFNTIICFKQTFQNDLDKLEEIGFNREELKNLSVGEYREISI